MSEPQARSGLGDFFLFWKNIFCLGSGGAGTNGHSSLVPDAQSRLKNRDKSLLATGTKTLLCSSGYGDRADEH